MQLAAELQKGDMNLGRARAIAIAIIYVVNTEIYCEKGPTQQSLANLAKTTEVTIRKYTRLIREHVNLAQFIATLSFEE
jgi:transcription initiation factor TFIIIB Brf1 subunit/transcription initiation factor TFIIB